MPDDAGVDAANAAKIAKNYAVTMSPIADFTFRIYSVNRNTEQNIWKVLCEYYSAASDKQPTIYLIRVDVARGAVVDINKAETPR